MDIPVDKVKFVVTQLNTILPLGWKQLNLLSYDNLRSEQRIQLLLEVFKAIDPTVSLFVTISYASRIFDMFTSQVSEITPSVSHVTKVSDICSFIFHHTFPFLTWLHNLTD